MFLGMLACTALMPAPIAALQAPPKPAVIEAVTFATHRRMLYVPLRQVCKHLSVPLGMAPDGRVQVAGDRLDRNGKLLPSGERLVPLRSFEKWGATIGWDARHARATLTRKGKSVYVHRGAKRVIIEKSNQRLIALQGTRTVFRAAISTGKAGYETPNGNFAVGWKARFHRSTLYDNAPMPYSVQIKGDIFAHGYAEVPNRPASHGCIRLAIPTARFFYDWVEKGTPIKVTGTWKR